MSLFEKRPLALGCFFFILASYTGAYVNDLFRIILLITAVGTALVFFALSTILKKSKRMGVSPSVFIQTGFYASAVAAAMTGSFLYFDDSYGKMQTLSDTRETVEVSVENIVYNSSHYAIYETKIQTPDSLSGKKLILTLDLGGFELGDILRADVVFSPLKEQFFDFHSEHYYLSRGIMLAAENAADTVPTYVGTDASFTVRLNQFRAKTAERILSRTNRSDGRYLTAALLLGVDNEMPASIDKDFSRLGISHMLSISGMHLSILLTLLDAALKRLKIGKRVRCFLALPCILLIFFATGCSDSMMRACIMLFLYRLSFLLERRDDDVTSLFFAVALILAFSPKSALDIGLLLSFLAMLSFMFSSQMTRKFAPIEDDSEQNWRRILKPLTAAAKILLVTVIVSILTLPVMCLNFGELSLITPIANLIFSPLFTLLLYIAPFTIFGGILSPVGEFFCFLANGIGSIIVFLAEKISALPGITTSLKFPGMHVAILLLCFALFLLFLCRRKHIRITASFLALSLLFTAGCIIAGRISLSQNDRLLYITNNKNDGFVLITDGRTLLCDISDGSFGATRPLLYFSAEAGICDIDAYMLTHYHSRHITTFRRICENINLLSLILPVPENDSEKEIFDALSDAAAEYGIPIITVKGISANSGEILDFYHVEITLGSRHDISRSSHPVIALSFSSDHHSVIYGGSSFNEADCHVFTDAFPAPDIVIYGAHGPIYKKEFLPITGEIRTICSTAAANFGSISTMAEPTEASEYTNGYTLYEIPLSGK